MGIRIQGQKWKIRQDHCPRVAEILYKETRQRIELRGQDKIPYTRTLV